MSENREGWIKFWCIVILVNVFVCGAFGVVWYILKDTDRVGFLSLPIFLWSFAMIMTFIGIFLNEREEKQSKKNHYLEG